ncbi:MAG: hypothetical protein WEB13_12595 [Dehalococcoidia bacterium]
MNVILNTDEVHAVLTLVTAHVLDHVELSDEAKKQIRAWRRERDPSTVGLDEFTETMNEAIGNFIDQRTTRFLRKRGKIRVSASTEREA